MKPPKKTDKPMPIRASKEILEALGANYGDIITMGSKENPARCQRTGIPIPYDLKMVLVPPEHNIWEEE